MKYECLRCGKDTEEIILGTTYKDGVCRKCAEAVQTGQQTLEQVTQ